MAIKWQVPSIQLLRHLIDDDDETNYTYSDSRLSRLLLSAAFIVLREATFSQDFVADIAEQEITPNPVDVENGTNDENLINLICLKAACILANGAAIRAANNAVAGKDTVSSWDLKGVAQHTIDLLEKGWCKVYAEAMEDYLYGDGIIGAAVMGPFRTIARGYGRNLN